MWPALIGGAQQQSRGSTGATTPSNDGATCSLIAVGTLQEARNAPPGCARLNYMERRQ